MKVLRVTPVRNVMIGKRSYRSEKPDMFFNKVVNESTPISVNDVSDRKQKSIFINEINTRNHRMVINNRKFFICSIMAG